MTLGEQAEEIVTAIMQDNHVMLDDEFCFWDYIHEQLRIAFEAGQIAAMSGVQLQLDMRKEEA